MLPALFRVALSAGLLAIPVAAAAGDLPRQRAGKYEVSLRLPAGGLYAEEEMQIEFRVVDTSQVDPLAGPAPVVRAQIQATIDMPSMPGMPKYEEMAHPEGIPGEYGVHPTFAHGGEYALQLAVAPPGDEAFTVKFALQVLDADNGRKRKPGPRPFSLELKSHPKNLKAGQPAELELLVHARERPKAIVSSFEIVHEKLMHLAVLRSDLTHFAHLHPDRAADGSFRIQTVFPAGGEYHLFAEIAPKGAGAQVLMARVKVAGDPGARFDITKASADQRSLVKHVEGTAIELQCPQKVLPAKKTIEIAFSLKDAATAQAVTDIQPWLGAMGHLLLVDQDGVTFVHSHPDERRPDAGRSGTVPFLVRFPKPGLYRGWAQFQRHGQVLTADFIVRVGEEAAAGAGQ